MTLEQIGRDRLTHMAAEHWSNGSSSAFSPDLVERVYARELSGGSASLPSPQRLQLLELSQYLEQYLWPNFSASSSHAHVMSMVLLVNEKYRQNLPAWSAFAPEDEADGDSAAPPRLALFFQRLVSLDVASLSLPERLSLLLFFSAAFQSLENSPVRAQVLRLVSLPLWTTLSAQRLQLELHRQPALLKPWRALLRREARAQREAGEGGAYVECVDRPEVSAVSRMADAFLDSLLRLDPFSPDPSLPMQIACCEAGLQLFTDLLSQLPTRRFSSAVLEEKGVLAKAAMSALAARAGAPGQAGARFAQLLDLHRLYARFAVDDHSGEALTDEEAAARRYERLCALQRLAFEHGPPALREGLAFESCARAGDRRVLEEVLKKLEYKDLKLLATRQLCVADERDPWAASADYLVAACAEAYALPRAQTAALRALPLYPTEKLLFDEGQLPELHVRWGEAGLKAGGVRGRLKQSDLVDEPAEEEKEDEDEAEDPETNPAPRRPPRLVPPPAILPLPKLNLQFLTPADYLLRNFYLYRLEAAYEIREDVADAVRRLAPTQDPATGELVLRGWARMASRALRCAVTEVGRPRVGEEHPSRVLAELAFSLHGMRPEVRAEWEALRVHDVVFLLVLGHDQEAADHAQASPGSLRSEMQALGLRSVRGAEVVEVRDEKGQLLNDFSGRANAGDGPIAPAGEERTLLLALDPAQFEQDGDSAARLVEATSAILRRDARENNFKAVLESVRDALAQRECMPPWLQDVLLGYGDPAGAGPEVAGAESLRRVDFRDTFLDEAHLREAFPGSRLEVASARRDGQVRAPFRVEFAEPGEFSNKRKAGADQGSAASSAPLLRAEAYDAADPGPYPEDAPPLNAVRFTPVQAQAILGGLRGGLNVIVGPPGTGKTDTAVQLLHLLHANFPKERILVVAHSNQALNDVFSKLLQRDVPSRYLVRLGAGEAELGADEAFSRVGRVNAALARRLELLARVADLASALNVRQAGTEFTCETAAHFWLLHVLSRWEKFLADLPGRRSGKDGQEGGEARGGEEEDDDRDAQDAPVVASLFPFAAVFADAPQPLFRGTSFRADVERAKGCFRHLRRLFRELEELRPFEILRSSADRLNYLLTCQARVVAMTCTHAALRRRDFVRLGLGYDTLVMEEAAQVTEVETFVPLLLQRSRDGRHRLKRVVLLGDHHQLPPVVKSAALQRAARLDQSMFARLVRLGVPYTELDAQGRARPSIAALYAWRYRGLGDLPRVREAPAYRAANAGLGLEFQLVDVAADGRGAPAQETSPLPHFYQNLPEAEALVELYVYLRAVGHPAASVAVLTTYNGQRALLADALATKARQLPWLGPPAAVATVDKFQGQQAPIVLLSLVRTRAFGHLRDVRRLVVALSRAQLGLYVFGRAALWAQCLELQPCFAQLLARPTQLLLAPHERHPHPDLGCARPVHASLVPGVVPVQNVAHLRAITGQVLAHGALPVGLPEGQEDSAAAAVEEEDLAAAAQEEDIAAAQEEEGIAAAQEEEDIAAAQEEKGIAAAQEEEDIAAAQEEKGIAAAQEEKGIAAAEEDQDPAAAESSAAMME